MLCCVELSTQPTCVGLLSGMVKIAMTDGWVYAGGVDKPGLALLPVGDLLDHDPERHVSWHTGPTGTDPFSFVSHSPVSKASPVSMQVQVLLSAACSILHVPSSS